VPRLFATLAGVLLLARVAHGEPGRLLGDDTFAVTRGGPYLFDAGLLVGEPAALPAGITSGIGVGFMRECGCLFSYGARASWSTESVSSTAWTVTHWDMRLRGFGMIRHDAGRGMLALRLGAGPTFVHEHRVRNQGMRAGLTGSDLENSATDTLPAAELEAVVGVHVTGAWLGMISAGPSVDIFDGNVRGGWIAQIGVGWQP
jgi:hypothetical protein